MLYQKILKTKWRYIKVCIADLIRVIIYLIYYTRIVLLTNRNIMCYYKVSEFT